MISRYFKHMMQAAVLLCTSLVVVSCDDFFVSEDNPIPTYLTMSDKPVTIKVNDTYKRTAIAVSDAVVVYSSSDTDVATVDQNGTVEGVADGTATITAKATGYSTHGRKIFIEDSKSYEVTVTGGNSNTGGGSAAPLSNKYRVYTSGTAYTDEPIPAGATVVESSAADVTWSAGTYVVEGSKTITGDITLTGNVNLILRDGAELTVNGRIVGGDKSFNIYGQTAGTGKLTMDGNAGTGALNNILVQNLQIHGGDITGTNSNWAITTNGTFKIFHGTVSATAFNYGLVAYKDLSIYGGTITALTTASSAHKYAVYVYNAAMQMTGGSLTATSTGADNHGIFVDKDINISGGTVNATGGSSTTGDGGIGIYCYYENITISGTANVTAKGGNSGNGPGGDGIKVFTNGKSLTISGGTVNATAGVGTNGQEFALVSGTSSGSINITGGHVTATAAGTHGIGIQTVTLQIGQPGSNPTVNATGALEGISATTITINSGTVTSTATGYSSFGIVGTSGGKIEIFSGKLIATGGDAQSGSNSSGGDGIRAVPLIVHNGEVIATGGAKAGTGVDGLGVDGGSTITIGAGVTYYAGNSANPSTNPSTTTPGPASFICNQRYVEIK